MTDSTDETIGGETPPVSQTSWLSQFDRFKDEAIAELRKVVEEGLTPTENDVLVWMAKEFILLAKKHDPNAFARVEAAVKLAESEIT